MKVDKAVCTTKDTTTTTAQQKNSSELSRTIQYETIFTTLVENKILAIKKECAETRTSKKTKRQKQAKTTFGRIFFNKRFFGKRNNRSTTAKTIEQLNEIDQNIKISNNKEDSLEVVIDVEKNEIKNSATIDNHYYHSTQTYPYQHHHEMTTSLTNNSKNILNTTTTKTAKTSSLSKLYKINNDGGGGGGGNNIIESFPEFECANENLNAAIAQNVTAAQRKFNSSKYDSNGSGSNGNDSLDGKEGVRNLIVEAVTHSVEVIPSSQQKLTIPDQHQYLNDEIDDSRNVINNDENKNDVTLNESSEQQNYDSCSIGSARIDESTNADGSLTSIKDSFESLSFPSSYCTISASVGINSSGVAVKTLVNDNKRRDSISRLRVLEARSISAQCSPVLPRQTKYHQARSLHHYTGQMETYQPAQVLMTDYHYKLPKNQVSYSSNLINNETNNIISVDNTNTKLINNNNYNYNNIITVDNSNIEKFRYFSRQNTSEDSINLTVSTLLHEADSINAFSGGGVSGDRKSRSTSLLVTADKDNQKSVNRLDSNRYNQSNQLATTTNNYLPIITTTTITSFQHRSKELSSTSVANTKITTDLWPITTMSIHYPFVSAAITKNSSVAAIRAETIDSAAAAISTPLDNRIPSQVAIETMQNVVTSNDTAKLQRMASTSTGSSVAPTGCCNTKAFSKDKDKRQKPLWQAGQSGSDDEYRKKKRKYKRYHRCSDPVLVYPSSKELQHCILSIPPNEPIQFYYNDDYIYDMSLQVEADQIDDLQAIVPSHRSKKHSHHKNKKKRRHKAKILVHDLDTQSVKVIDPDDLPQRARWTIIATACLLLLMCLMLVGITLRMAPIIDDMVAPM